VEALIYGYLRDDLADGHSDELEDALRTLAPEEGLCFAAKFHESTSGDVRPCRADTGAQSVPTRTTWWCRHSITLPGQTIPRDILIAKLANEAGGPVLTLES